MFCWVIVWDTMTKQEIKKDKTYWCLAPGLPESGFPGLKLWNFKIPVNPDSKDNPAEEREAFVHKLTFDDHFVLKNDLGQAIGFYCLAFPDAGDIKYCKILSLPRYGESMPLVNKKRLVEQGSKEVAKALEMSLPKYLRQAKMLVKLASLKDPKEEEEIPGELAEKVDGFNSLLKEISMVAENLVKSSLKASKKEK